MKCPYCAEEIESAAVKCKHCGEWLNRSRGPSSIQADHVDNSRINFYTVLLKSPGQKSRYISISSENETLLRDFIREKYKGWYIDEEYGIRIKAPGKYSCPNCRSKYARCERHIGCAVLIIIFISFGLGLIMIPFLPYNCKCELCGYSWKS